MGLATVIGIGLAGATLASSIGEKKEAEYNAKQAVAESSYNASALYQQAGMIDDQKKLQAYQDSRLIRFTMGKTVSSAAGRGIELSGSPMAIMIDTRTQLEMDKAIGQYNLSVQKYSVLSEAESVKRGGAITAGQYERSGKAALTSGITGSITQLYSTEMYRRASAA